MMKSKVFEHAGYVGSIEVSAEDECLYGKLLFIDDLVTYESDNFFGLKQAFVEAVENYLVRCAEQGIRPDKPCSGSFNIRITPELHKLSQYEAARRGIGLNDFVKRAIENELRGDRVEIHNHTHSHEHLHTHVSSAEMVTETLQVRTRKWSHEKTKAALH